MIFFFPMCDFKLCEHSTVFHIFTMCGLKSCEYGEQPEGGPGKQVTTTGVGPGNVSRWKLVFFQKFEFEKRGYFGTTKKNSKIKTQVTPRQRPGKTR